MHVNVYLGNTGGIGLQVDISNQ